MEGSVLHYDKNENTGLLRCNDGNKFQFKRTDWLADVEPRENLGVDFVVEDNKATQIFVVKSSVVSGISSDLSKKVSEIDTSAAAEKVKEFFSGGMKNKFGVIATASVLVSLFLPALATLNGSRGLVDMRFGVLSVLLLLVIAILLSFGNFLEKKIEGF